MESQSDAGHRGSIGLCVSALSIAQPTAQLYAGFRARVTPHIKLLVCPPLKNESVVAKPSYRVSDTHALH